MSCYLQRGDPRLNHQKESPFGTQNEADRRRRKMRQAETEAGEKSGFKQRCTLTMKTASSPAMPFGGVKNEPKKIAVAA